MRVRPAVLDVDLNVGGFNGIREAATRRWETEESDVMGGRGKNNMLYRVRIIHVKRRTS
jgi:hypothetical protein